MPFSPQDVENASNSTAITSLLWTGGIGAAFYALRKVIMATLKDWGTITAQSAERGVIETMREELGRMAGRIEDLEKTNAKLREELDSLKHNVTADQSELDYLIRFINDTCNCSPDIKKEFEEKVKHFRVLRLIS